MIIASAPSAQLAQDSRPLLFSPSILLLLHAFGISRTLAATAEEAPNGRRSFHHRSIETAINNCDTVRLAIRLRFRRISCTFGLSRLAEKAGSCREVRLESKSGKARSCGSSPASTLAAERAVVFAKASELGLEGIVSKRQGSSYRSVGEATVAEDEVFR